MCEELKIVKDILDNLTQAQFVQLRMADFAYWEEVKNLANKYQYPCEACRKLHWKGSKIGRKHLICPV